MLVFSSNAAISLLSSCFVHLRATKHKKTTAAANRHLHEKQTNKKRTHTKQLLISLCFSLMYCLMIIMFNVIMHSGMSLLWYHLEWESTGTPVHQCLSLVCGTVAILQIRYSHKSLYLSLRSELIRKPTAELVALQEAKLISQFTWRFVWANPGHWFKPSLRLTSNKVKETCV